MISYNKLFKLLKQNKLKNCEFAEKAGISQNTLAKLSKDEYVSMAIIVKICNFFDCKVDDILDVLPASN